MYMTSRYCACETSDPYGKSLSFIAFYSLREKNKQKSQSFFCI